MPTAVYILGLSIFAQGTSELMLAGLLPDLAADLGVSIPRAGLLISAFALGMLVGAPLLAVVTLRWPRRNALLVFLAIFVAAHVVGALSGDYWVILATRVVSAFVYAGFWALAAATAVSLVAPWLRGRAMSVVAGGLTLATIIGVPAGTVIGQHLGWRAAFWAVAGLSALSMIGVFTKIPGGRPATVAPLRGELRVMANPRLWVSYGATALSTGAAFVIFAYLGAMLADTTGIAPAWIPVVLGLYGAGGLIGITVGGRFADAHPFRTLYVGAAGMTVAAAAIAVTAHSPAPMIALVLLLGAFGFATNPALNTRVFALAEGAPTLAAATNYSAFNVGITVGPWLGGLAIGAGLGFTSIGWIGAGLGLAMLVTVGLSHRLERENRTAAATSEPPMPALIHP
ncbi:Cmx/CmrA family chloramphenicol efflux MFS transporter [Nocardia alba]|uniref:DHA1 family chloramphenicol resistance protein-like MFS transporter n=1 Tax=Nocardia alba TaxID=225051 RepID=A0A4R1FE72_9NOCA|nr:Cmx/CmrA family chloramphenicol efflux MFS transporter [Nocardia alba]TCJ90088.1 DHA1 family chloramphenicol resistance protein-like MFS transporter [Nocardia alba]